MISVIIPTYNEERALPATLTHLFAQPGTYEVLVVDGGSDDRTCEIVQAEPRLRLLSANKGRARQMNAGARQATGEWLLFLHADTWLPDGALARIGAMSDDPPIQARGFLHRFAGNDRRLRLISALDNYRCRRSKIMYGDQAMFIRRQLFEELGGFPDQAYLEDLAFGTNLVQRTTPILLAPPIITDGRKFIKMGVWRSLTRVCLIILHEEIGLPFFPRSFFADVR